MMKIKKMNLFIATIAWTFFLVLAGSPWAYETVPVINGGEISGRVTLKGETPLIQSHKVIHNPEFCGDMVADETYVINPSNHALQNAVISIEGISRGKKHDFSTLLLNNRNCRFQPHTLAGMVGDFYEVKNSDPILHNTHLKLNDLTILNVAMPPNGKNIKKPLTQTGIISMKCDAHTFMKGNILVFDHPYFSVTDPEGFFKITDIPPGHYKIKIWHDGIPVKEKEVAIGSNEKVNLSTELMAK